MKNAVVDDALKVPSHYAEYHKGFCIEFMINDTCLLDRLAQPVKYTEILPVTLFEKSACRCRGYLYRRLCVNEGQAVEV